MTEVSNDLNTVIVAAVNARVEAAVAEALSGNQLMAQYVGQALSQEVEIKDNNYNRRKTTFLKHSIEGAIQGAAKKAIEQFLVDEVAEIEKVVKAELKAQIPGIAKQLVGTLSDAASKAYGVEVKLKMPGSY